MGYLQWTRVACRCKWPREGLPVGAFGGSPSHLNNKRPASLINKRQAGLFKYADKPEAEGPGEPVRGLWDAGTELSEGVPGGFFVARLCGRLKAMKHRVSGR